jgi:hypothetical protein
MIPSKFINEVGIKTILIWTISLALAIYWIFDERLQSDMGYSLLAIILTSYLLIIFQYMANKITELNDLTHEMISKIADRYHIKQPSPFGIERVYVIK